MRRRAVGAGPLLVEHGHTVLQFTRLQRPVESRPTTPHASDSAHKITVFEHDPTRSARENRSEVSKETRVSRAGVPGRHRAATQRVRGQQPVLRDDGRRGGDGGRHLAQHGLHGLQLGQQPLRSDRQTLGTARGRERGARLGRGPADARWTWETAARFRHAPTRRAAWPSRAAATQPPAPAPSSCA